MNLMKRYEAFSGFWGWGEKICFVRPFEPKKPLQNKFRRVKKGDSASFCFIRFICIDNMRVFYRRSINLMNLMKRYEVMGYKAIFLPCIKVRAG
jgi:hypothetical protein